MCMYVCDAGCGTLTRQQCSLRLVWSMDSSPETPRPVSTHTHPLFFIIIYSPRAPPLVILYRAVYIHNVHAAFAVCVCVQCLYHFHSARVCVCVFGIVLGCGCVGLSHCVHTLSSGKWGSGGSSVCPCYQTPFIPPVHTVPNRLLYSGQVHTIDPGMKCAAQCVFCT